MGGSIMSGRCGVCGKDGPLTRTYFRLPIKCDCHSPEHFDIVDHCTECAPARPNTKIYLTSEQAEALEKQLSEAERQNNCLAAMTAERDTFRAWALGTVVDMFNPVFVNRDGTERPTALAVDFDGTLCEPAWPGIGTPNMWLIERLIAFREQGGELILWTNREDETLQAAVDFCASLGLQFDTVNENLPRWKECFKNDTRKVGADRYIDDKAVCIKAEWRVQVAYAAQGTDKVAAVEIDRGGLAPAT